MPDDELITTQPEDPAETPQPPEGTVDQPPDPAILQSEIERLQALREQKEKEAKDAEEKAIYWRKQKAETRAEFFKEREKPPERPPVSDAGGVPPRKEDFDDYDKYVDALTEFKTTQKLAQWRAEEDQRKNQTETEQRLRQFAEKLNEGYSLYSDFEEVVKDPSLPITPVLRDALAESTIPAEVAYYLGKNRGETIKLSRMTPIQAGREIMRIESKIAAEKGINPNPGTPKLPSAPPPIKPVGQSNTVSTPLDKMSQKEFEAEMEKRTGRRF